MVFIQWKISNKNWFSCHGPASSVVSEIYKHAHKTTAIITADKLLVWKQFVDEIFDIVIRLYIHNFYHHLNELHSGRLINDVDEWLAEERYTFVICYLFLYLVVVDFWGLEF